MTPFIIILNPGPGGNNLAMPITLNDYSTGIDRQNNPNVVLRPGGDMYD